LRKEIRSLKKEIDHKKLEQEQLAGLMPRTMEDAEARSAKIRNALGSYERERDTLTKDVEMLTAQVLLEADQITALVRSHDTNPIKTKADDLPSGRTISAKSCRPSAATWAQQRGTLSSRTTRTSSSCSSWKATRT